MSDDPESSEIGEIIQEAYKCEVITWKIPNVSSLEISNSTEILSPSFLYERATWVLKMFPCGWKGFDKTDFDEKSRVEVHLERLDSEIPVHNYFCRCCFKQQNVNAEYYDGYYLVKFDSKKKENRINRYLPTMYWYDMFYHDRSYRWNDTITLETEILTENDATIGLYSETNLSDTNLCSKFDKNSDSLKPIGELFIASFYVNSIAWKIPKVPSIPVEVDNRVQSPMFSFAGVSWILKLFLCGQTKFKTKDVDVVIERRHSHIQSHTVLYKIFFTSYYENDSFIKDYCTNIPFHCAKGSLKFDSENVQENILEIESYKAVREYANYSPQFGTAGLVCEFQIPKKTKIQLIFQMKSLQSFKDSLPLKTENTVKTETGEIMKKSFECDVISWTIPSFSSILFAESTEMGSPPFSYKGAIWILKVSRQSRTKDFTKVIIKRLKSQFAVHNFYSKSFFKNYRDETFSHESKSFISFNENSKQGHAVWSCYNKNFYLYNECRSNDILTFVCELYTEKNSVIEMDFKAKFSKETLGNINTESDVSPKSVGDLFTETYDVEMIAWKIPKARSFPTEVDYGVRSPSFPFAGASWNLEVFPFGQKKFESERNVDVVIERAFSLLPKHPVSYTMHFENEFDKKDCSLKEFGMMLDCSIRGSFIFESSYVKENVCCAISYGDFLNLIAPNRPSDTVFLVCDLRVKNKDGNEMDIQRKLAKSLNGSSEKKSEQIATSSVFSSKAWAEKKPEQTATASVSFSKGSTEKKSEQTATSKVSSSKGSPEKKSEQTATSSVSSCKESSENKSEQTATSSVSSSKGCDNATRDSVDVSNEKLLQDLKELFLKQEDCDVVLNVKGQEFGAHRLILKARSTVFASTFKHDMKEKATGVVDIEDCEPSSFPDFLYFLYCGSTVNLSPENVFSLFTTADKYDVQDLRLECLKFMRKNLSVNTFCDTIALALQHSERELIELATDFFSKNLQKIILTVKWQSFLVGNPIQANELLIKALASNTKQQ